MNAASIAPHGRMSLLNKIYSYFPQALVNKVLKMLGEVLGGWCPSAVQTSSLKFRHFSKASLIPLNAMSLQAWAETPARMLFSAVFQLPRFPLEDGTAQAYKPRVVSCLTPEVSGALGTGRDLGWQEHRGDWFQRMGTLVWLNVWSGRSLW